MSQLWAPALHPALDQPVGSAPLPPLQGGHLLRAAFPAPSPPLCSRLFPPWMVYSVAARCLPRSSLAASGSMVVCHGAQLLGLGRDGARTPGLTPWETLRRRGWWTEVWIDRPEAQGSRLWAPCIGEVRRAGPGLKTQGWLSRRRFGESHGIHSCHPVLLPCASAGHGGFSHSTCTPRSEPQQGRHRSWPLPAPCHPQQRHSRFCFPGPDPCLPSVTCLPCHLSSLRRHLSSRWPAHLCCSGWTPSEPLPPTSCSPVTTNTEQ